MSKAGGRGVLPKATSPAPRGRRGRLGLVALPGAIETDSGAGEAWGQLGGTGNQGQLDTTEPGLPTDPSLFVPPNGSRDARHYASHISSGARDGARRLRHRDAFSWVSVVRVCSSRGGGVTNTAPESSGP